MLYGVEDQGELLGRGECRDGGEERGGVRASRGDGVGEAGGGLEDAFEVLDLESLEGPPPPFQFGADR
jgi:hypothetical protein